MFLRALVKGPAWRCQIRCGRRQLRLLLVVMCCRTCLQGQMEPSHGPGWRKMTGRPCNADCSLLMGTSTSLFLSFPISVLSLCCCLPSYTRPRRKAQHAAGSGRLLACEGEGDALLSQGIGGPHSCQGNGHLDHNAVVKPVQAAPNGRHLLRRAAPGLQLQLHRTASKGLHAGQQEQEDSSGVGSGGREPQESPLEYVRSRWKGGCLRSRNTDQAPQQGKKRRRTAPAGKENAALYLLCQLAERRQRALDVVAL